MQRLLAMAGVRAQAAVTADGKPVRHYAQNVLTNALTAEVSIPLALSDRPGTWQLRATDVGSGQSASAPMVVRQGAAGKPGQ